MDLGNDVKNKNVHFIIPQEVLIKVLGILLVLTVITVTASRIDFGFFNTVIALFIASVKASLVMSFFMGLKYDVKLNRIIAVIGFFFLALLIAFCATDIWTRYNPRP